jgi:hypothetical protein
MKSDQHKQEAFQKAWAKIVARAWRDEAFKRQLLKNPTQVLKEHGIEAPGINFHVHASSKTDCYLDIPPAPANASRLGDEEVKLLIGAGGHISVIESQGAD